MKKPTGKSGITRVSVDSSGSSTIEFIPNSFPEKKDDIEEYIVENFIDSANKELSKSGESFLLSSPQKIELDDFDFKIIGPNGESYLELMEAAPLKGVKGGYSNAPNQYCVKDIAEFIYSKLKSKSDKYPTKMVSDLFLLLYTTHYSFSLSKTVVSYLRWLLREKPLIFNAVFLYTPIDQECGEVMWLSPVPPVLLEGFDPDAVAQNIVHSFAPDGWSNESNQSL